MAKPQDLDILARSLSGDWQARIELFQRFIWDNPRVRRLGSKSKYLDDFLHDSFTNVLRTSHSFDPEQDLGEWILSVAAWTALERHRLLDHVVGATSPTRMCAAIEGDEPDSRSRLTSYVPPRSGPEDSLLSRIARLVGEPQFTLLSKMGVEGGTCEDAATAAGKPLNTVGPLLVRTIDSLSRFFGAPPPLNDDLEPVLVCIVREDATESRGDPLKPKGRILPMQLDREFYTVTPEIRRIGLSVPSEARTIALWNAARATTPPGEALSDHLSQCHYCADLLRALLLMQQALHSDPHASFLLCPGGFTLMNTPSETNEAFDQHLAECALCRQEHTHLLGVVEGDVEPGSGASRNPRAAWGRKIALAAIVLLVLGGGYLAGRRYFGMAGPTSQPILSETPPPAVAVDPRFSGLAEPVPISDPRWNASVLPENRRMFSWLVAEIQSRRKAAAAVAASGLADKDPGIQMLYAELEYQLKGISYGYQGMLKAEAMPPRNSFRCWVTLQAAVIVGDMNVISREVEHLSSDPAYADRAKTLLARVHART